jgi:hypothetical protein
VWRALALTALAPRPRAVRIGVCLVRGRRCSQDAHPAPPADGYGPDGGYEEAEGGDAGGYDGYDDDDDDEAEARRKADASP